MDILEIYKREAPELFARLPLPKPIAEKYGVPIREDVIGMNEYLKKFMQSQEELIQEVEEKQACEIKSDVKSLTNVGETTLNSGQIPEQPSTPETGSK